MLVVKALAAELYDGSRRGQPLEVLAGLLGGRLPGARVLLGGPPALPDDLLVGAATSLHVSAPRLLEGGVILAGKFRIRCGWSHRPA
jgi:hypothetical protein